MSIVIDAIVDAIMDSIMDMNAVVGAIMPPGPAMGGVLSTMGQGCQLCMRGNGSPRLTISVSNAESSSRRSRTASSLP